MTPKKTPVCHKTETNLTDRMLFCVWSATIAYNYLCIIKRLI